MCLWIKDIGCVCIGFGLMLFVFYILFDMLVLVENVLGVCFVMLLIMGDLVFCIVIVVFVIWVVYLSVVSVFLIMFLVYL